MPPEIHDDDDEPDTWPCYRHSGRMTALRCGECDRPVCTDCAIPAAVGIKCPDDARQSPAALARVPRDKFARGLGAGAVSGAVAGWLQWNLNSGFFTLILAYGLGMAVGEVVRRAAGGFRDPSLAKAAAAFAFLGILIWPLLYLLAGGRNGTALAYGVISAAIAAYAAHTRAT